MQKKNRKSVAVQQRWSKCNISNSESFKLQPKTTGRTPIASNTKQTDTKDVKVAVPLKYLSSFWRTLEMPLINCEINVVLT